MMSMGDQPVQQSELCWFCGAWRQNYWRGSSVGEMIYSSEINISSELAYGWDDTIRPCHHSAKESICVICENCARRFAAGAGLVEAEYVRQVQSHEPHQFIEEMNTDTLLNCPSQPKEYPFGCWIMHYPDIGIRLKFESLTMLELFQLGYRFRGKIHLNIPECELFFARFDIPEYSRVDVPKDFIDHIDETMDADNVYYGVTNMRDGFSTRFAQLRACVYDVSVCEIVETLDRSEDEIIE
ncbi:MAG: hypothetical protein CMJ46_01060 [Planctomyces sp.]|nr:hypothetical protein [Planctomyces sp.]